MALRPPVAHDRIHMTNTGQVRLELRHRWSDGTTHVLFDPIEFQRTMRTTAGGSDTGRLMPSAPGHSSWGRTIYPALGRYTPVLLKPGRKNMNGLISETL